jgi:hypothetical protein
MNAQVDIQTIVTEAARVGAAQELTGIAAALTGRQDMASISPQDLVRVLAEGLKALDRSSDPANRERACAALLAFEERLITLRPADSFKVSDSLTFNMRQCARC